MPITCNPVLTAPTGGYMGSAPHGYAGPFFWNGFYYIIYLISDVTYPSAGTAVLRSADLVTWNTILFNGPSNPNPNSPGRRFASYDTLAMLQIGSEVWVFLPNFQFPTPPPPTPVEVFKFDLAAEAWLAPVLGVVNVPVLSEPGNYRPLLVAAARGNNAVLLYSGALANRVYWSEFDGTQWLAPAASLPVPDAAYDYVPVSECLDTNGFLHFFVTGQNAALADTDPLKNILYHVSLSPASVFGTMQAVTDYLDPRNGAASYYAAREISNAHEAGGELRILVTRADGLPANPLNPQPAIWTAVGTIAADPVWTVSLVTNTLPQPSSTNVPEYLASAFISGTHYAFWPFVPNDNSQSIIYYSAFTGGVWQAPVVAATLLNNVAVNSISIDVANGIAVLLMGSLVNDPFQYTEAFYAAGLGAGLSVSCNNPPNGTVGSAYSHTFPASGGTAPYTFAIAAGSLPNGLVLNALTGAVSGSPTAAGTFNFDIQVTDSLGSTATASCSITIAAALAIPGGLPSGIQGCRPRNRWDWCMFFEFLLYSQIHFPPLCSLPKEFRNWLPWDEDFGANAVPPGSVPLHQVRGIVTPLPAAGDQTILETRIPVGYDGLLAGIFHFYSGNGFVQGSGDIVWRLQLNQRYLEDLGNVPYSLGSPQSPMPLTEGQILLSGQTLRYLVNVPNLSGLIQVGQSQITAGLIGFLWPR